MSRPTVTVAPPPSRSNPFDESPALSGDRQRHGRRSRRAGAGPALGRLSAGRIINLIPKDKNRGGGPAHPSMGRTHSHNLQGAALALEPDPFAHRRFCALHGRIVGRACPDRLVGPVGLTVRLASDGLATEAD